jgi:sugar phosphate isomerase/epimerase
MLDRRAFLATAAAALAASRARAGAMGMQFHLSCGAIGIRASQMQAIDWAHQFGFDVVDADGGYLARIGDDERRRLLDHMQSVHVGWAMAGVPFEYREDEARFLAGMNGFRPYAEALRKAGVERVTTWIMPSHKDRPFIANFRLHASRLREIARVLADNNTRFGLEYVAPRTLLLAERYPFIHTMAEMKELISEIGQPNVGMVLDSWHWYHAGDTAADIQALKPSEVVSVDLNDAPAGVPKDTMQDGSRELPAATGVIDVRAFLGSLAKIDFHGPVRAEPFNKAVNSMPPEQAIQATIAALKKAFAEAEVR